MAGFFILLIILLILFALPIALSLGMIGLLSYIVGGHNLINFHGQMTDGLVSFVILAVPLFILTGEILASGAVAKRMIDFASVIRVVLKHGRHETTCWNHCSPVRRTEDVKLGVVG